VYRSKPRGLWEAALKDYQYVIDHVPKDFILLPEVYTRRGEVELLLGQPNRALESFSHARHLKPDYWPAYSHWAEFLMKAGKRPEALNVVIAGLEYSPRAKVLLELFKILGGKPSDMPTPREIEKMKSESSPVTEHED
jgi:tetratricopeptide (TPR) repeat protein